MLSIPETLEISVLSMVELILYLCPGTKTSVLSKILSGNVNQVIAAFNGFPAVVPLIRRSGSK